MKMKDLLVQAGCVLACAAPALAGPSTLPSVTVSGVTATSPVVRSTPQVDVSATVSSVFDTGSTVATTASKSCRSSNDYCGTFDASVTDQDVVTTTVVTISNTSVSANAADSNSSAALAGNGSAFSGALTTPTSGTDGKVAVTVTGTVSEDVTTTVTIETINKSCVSSKGVTTCNTVGDTTAQPAVSTVTKGASASAAGSYLLDINPAILTLKPDQSQPTVMQGGDKNIHNVLIAGSSGTTFTVTDTVTSQDGSYTSSAATTDSFRAGNDGIAPDKHNLVGVHISCDAPLGTYTASAVANTTDLDGNAFDQILSQDYSDNKGNDSGGATGTFQVIPGYYLVNQTTVVSELPPTNDYQPMTCFTSGMSGKKVSTFPGSLHITATVNTQGPCAGFTGITGTVVTLTLPAGFSFDRTGASPAAHVFVGPAAGGFDFHNPSNFQEVTGLIPKPVVNGQTVTVDLTKYGAISSGNTIYVRAHATYTGTSVPGEGTQFLFTTSTTSNLAGIGSSTATESKTLTATSACVNGN